MSLLQDAARYEEQHWRNRLSGWCRQAARDYLGQLGKVVGLLVLSILLLDGARRDVSHGFASVVAVTGGATLQTARGKSAPAPSFVGQSYSLGDTLVTDGTGTVTVVFPDGSVVQLSPQSQLRLSQSDAFRNGRRLRHFELTSGSALVYGSADLATRFVVPGSDKTAQKNGGFAFDVRRGLSPGSPSALARYAAKPGFLVGLERVAWWPLDTLLGQLGIMGSGTLLTTDNQRRDACRRVCLDIHKALSGASNLPTGQPLPLEMFGLSAEPQSTGKSAIAGPNVILTQAGGNFIALVRARDSVGTVFKITSQGVQAQQQK
ncbi:FecR domain-containing protein [Armatimonas sp.]|uniref:FecR domain-containing protein n=1 Tax=Armatimonas sp. TaxID=1872638 RepID=UPI003750CEC4